MPVSVTMPALGESVTEGTITRWLKKEGERVEADEPLLEVSTDKVDTEIPSPAAGVLTRIVAAEDETVEVGAELAVIGDADDGAEPQQPAPAAEQPAAEEPPPAAPVAESPAPEPAAAPAASQEPAEGTEVTMPALGESVTDGTITRWLKAVGDSVEADEPLLEVSTDKVDTEIPSPVAGTLLEITAEEDATVEVGGKLAVIGAAGAPAAQSAAPQPTPEPQMPAPPAQPPAAPPSPAAPQAPAATSRPSAAGVYVTPLVRKLAAEHNVDLNTITGTGVGGRIRKQDVMAVVEAAEQPAAEAPAPARQPAAKPEASPLRGRTEKMPRIRQVIATRMAESLHTQAQLTSVIEVDLTKVAQLRTKAKDAFLAQHGVKLSYLPFMCVAAVEALRAYPVIQASLDMEAKTITYPDSENLGIAVDTERGLMVPVIKNAGELNLVGIAKRIADLAERTRTNKIGPDELSGGTFNITNTGSRGVLFDTPIVTTPQSAILGTGAVVKRAVVVNDPDLGEVIAPRSMVYLALSYDHRIIDGADAARFMSAVKQRLEEGNFEADLGL